MDRALDRLRLHYWHLWQVVREYRKNPEVLEDWQKAEKTTLAWRNGFFLWEALKVLSVALSK